MKLNQGDCVGLASYGSIRVCPYTRGMLPADNQVYCKSAVYHNLLVDRIIREKNAHSLY